MIVYIENISKIAENIKNVPNVVGNVKNASKIVGNASLFTYLSCNDL